MADYKTSLQKFYDTFKQNNTDFTLSKTKQASNNINAINTLLDSLIGDEEYREKVTSLLSTESINSVYTTKSNTLPAMPSYNTRSPYMEIWINGVQVIPTAINTDGYNGIDAVGTSGTSIVSGITGIIGSDSSHDLDVNFDNLNLDMPMAGVESTITGTLILYSRTPIEFLSFLTEAISTDENAGLPICKLRFGWNVARTDGEIERLTTPYISFLITNIGMTDPGKTMGSEFTLSLQDAGSVVLQNSSADVGLKENWPQEQLRIILEKFLGLRLFTLDDLLTLGENSENKKTLKLNAYTTNLKTQQQAINYINDLQKPQSDGRAPISGAEADSLRKAFFAAYTAAKTSGASEEEAVRRGFITDKTFFVTNPTPALRVNSNTFENVIASLLNKIVCRWYPSYNSQLSGEITKAHFAEDNIRDLKRQFDNSGETEQLTAALEEEKEKIASSCILIWVPFFPAGIYTSSNTFFGDISTEEGAFLLLPNIKIDYSLSSSSLPLIYGPGGSSVPYFYGGAQNVFARLTESVIASSKAYAHRVGEVLDVSANYNNLVTVMKANYDEEMVYRKSGSFLTSIAAVKLTKDQKKAQEEKQRALLEAEAKKKLGGLTPEAYVKKWESEAIPRFKSTRGRFKQSIAPRYLVNDVEYSNGKQETQSARSLALATLKNRVGRFLNYPYSIGMSLLGDPYLIRQGIGAFELINYYPTMNGDTLKFNPFLSGVYMPQKVTHKVSLGEYVTEVQAIKIPDTVKDSAKARIESIIGVANKTDSLYAKQVGAMQLTADAILEVNLETLRTKEGNALNVYMLNSQQTGTFVAESEKESKRLASLSLGEQAALISKYTTSSSTPDLETAKAAALRDYEVNILQNMVDTDPDLASQSVTTRNVLKEKIKAVHKQSTSAVDALNRTIGRAEYNQDGTAVAGTSDMSKLEALYSKLQTSRYEDIRNALASQTKGK